MNNRGLESGFFETIISRIGRGTGHLALQGAVPAARPYFVAGLASRINAPILVVTATNEEAEVFCEELNFFLPPDDRALLFPAWEVLPFEPMSPSAEISAERLATLARLLRSRRPVVVAPLEGVLQYLIPKGKLATAGLELQKGVTLSWRRLFRHFSESGYRQASKVEILGEYSRHGGILDFFPPGLPAPVRVELFGDEIESLRLFDPETQRNAGDLEAAEILPVREILLDGNVLGKLKAHLPSPAGEGDRDLLGEAARCSGLEHYQAILTGSRQTLLDYLPSEPLVVLSEYTDLESRGEKFRQEIWQEAERAIFPELFAPERAYLDFSGWIGGPVKPPSSTSTLSASRLRRPRRSGQKRWAAEASSSPGGERDRRRRPSRRRWARSGRARNGSAFSSLHGRRRQPGGCAISAPSTAWGSGNSLRGTCRPLSATPAPARPTSPTAP